MPVRWDLCAYASECEGDGCEESFSPAESIEGGVKELSGYLKKNNGDLVLALAYNAGPGNVRSTEAYRHLKKRKDILKILNIDVSK